MENQTTLTEFVLLGLSSDPPVQIFLFLMFFMIYLFTLLANGLIMLAIRVDFHLYSPMYYFLLQLSLVDTCYSSVTVPKLLLDLLSEHKTISVCGCIAQMFCIHLSAGAEVFTLSAMAYDRYVAICDPLRYVETMKKGICVLLGAGAWSMGFLNGLINTVFALQLHFCGNNQIHHFTCEFPPLLQLSCTSPLKKQLVLLSPALAFGLSSFLLILISYVHIISTILRMRSLKGRQKAFSTCTSHLTVVGLFYVTGFIQYTKPSSVSSVVLEEMVSIHYSILTPLLNPVIYSLQNKEIKTALRKILGKLRFRSGVSDIPSEGVRELGSKSSQQIRKCSSSKSSGPEIQQERISITPVQPMGVTLRWGWISKNS